MSHPGHFERLNLEELWTLHGAVSEVLQQKIVQEKQRLEDRLSRLRGPHSTRRPYPAVLPKYRNPDHPSETWTGRGKQPRWLAAQLRSGRTLDDLRIQNRRVGTR